MAIIGVVFIGLAAFGVVYNLVLPQLSGDLSLDTSKSLSSRRRFYPYADSPRLWLIAGLSFAFVFAYLAYFVSFLQIALGRRR